MKIPAYSTNSSDLIDGPLAGNIEWKTAVETRLESFGTTLEGILDILKANTNSGIGSGFGGLGSTNVNTNINQQVQQLPSFPSSSLGAYGFSSQNSDHLDRRSDPSPSSIGNSQAASSFYLPSLNSNVNLQINPNIRNTNMINIPPLQLGQQQLFQNSLQPPNQLGAPYDSSISIPVNSNAPNLFDPPIASSSQLNSSHISNTTTDLSLVYPSSVNGVPLFSDDEEKRLYQLFKTRSNLNSNSNSTDKLSNLDILPTPNLDGKKFSFFDSPSPYTSSKSSPVKNKTLDDKEPSVPKLSKSIQTVEIPENNFSTTLIKPREILVDFRKSGVITYKQANDLFDHFEKNIEPHLFGIKFINNNFDMIWKTSPILVAVITTISSIHHTTLNKLYKPMKKEFELLCQNILFNISKYESDSINIIFALCIASLWLPDSYMLTGIALRFATSIGLNLPIMHRNLSSCFGNNSNDPPVVTNRLKLWYLLFIIDGNQSLAYNRPPMVSKDSAISNSRRLLDINLNEAPDSTLGEYLKGLLREGFIPTRRLSTTRMILKGSDSDTPENRSLSQGGTLTKLLGKKEAKTSFSNKYNDMRLVSQLEYNSAIRGIFDQWSWDILPPSVLGIPWKTNIELDKWMVSWACLLTPTRENAWPSKSTLLHYNFAKMHINSTVMKKLQFKGGHLPQWVQLGNDSEDSNIGSNLSKEELDKRSREEAFISDSIAISSATAILKMATADEDVISNLRYVPVYIHVMLYYAALLLLHASKGGISSTNAPHNDEGSEHDSYSSRLELNIDDSVSISLVKALKKVLSENTPTEKHLSTQLVDGLTDALNQKLQSVKMDGFEEKIYTVEDDDLSEQGPVSIAAWPGTSHGHP